MDRIDREWSDEASLCRIDDHLAQEEPRFPAGGRVARGDGDFAGRFHPDVAAVKSQSRQRIALHRVAGSGGLLRPFDRPRCREPLAVLRNRVGDRLRQVNAHTRGFQAVQVELRDPRLAPQIDRDDHILPLPTDPVRIEIIRAADAPADQVVARSG